MRERADGRHERERQYKARETGAKERPKHLVTARYREGADERTTEEEAARYFFRHGDTERRAQAADKRAYW
jgi:hypothetical protein